MDHNRKHINRKYILLVWYKDPIRRVIQCQSLCTTCAALQIYRSRPGVGYGFGQKIIFIFIFIWLCIFNIQLLSKYPILPISYNSLNSKPIPCLTLPLSINWNHIWETQTQLSPISSTIWLNIVLVFNVLSFLLT